MDKSGKSIGSLLCGDRDKESAQAFFRAVVADERVPWPAKININGNKATLGGLRLLGDEDHRWRQVEVRASRYLNNVVEQDHRAIKQRCASMPGLKSFPSAASIPLLIHEQNAVAGMTIRWLSRVATQAGDHLAVREPRGHVEIGDARSS